MSETSKKVVLVIADISGYTEYMLANQTALDHSQVVMTQLLELILKRLEPPFEIAKLEGDAVFVYVEKDAQGKWSTSKNDIKDQLVDLFGAFRQKLKSMSICQACTCGACDNLDKLRLKIVAHSGEVAQHRIGPFVELTGLDVIVVHRLLKNSLTSNEYLLLTEPAYQDLDFGKTFSFLATEQSYQALGSIKGYYQLGETFLKPVSKN